MEILIKKLEKLEIRALQKLTDDPKDKDTKEFIGILQSAIDKLKKATGEGTDKIKAYGTIRIEIENYVFEKDERQSNFISVYKVDADGLLEFIHKIKLCTSVFDSLNNIDSIKDFVTEWYETNVKEGGCENV